MPADEARAVAEAQGPIGIIACAGDLPLEIARAAERSGRRVHMIAIEGFAEPGVERHPHTWINLGQTGRMIDTLRRSGCRDLVIAGAMVRPNLWRLKVDHGFFRSIATVLRLTRGGDDSVLRRVVGFFEAQGFRVLGVREVAPHLLAPAGPLGTRRPTPAQRHAMARAAHLIRALGPFDVGQAVVATENAIVAVEGARGTDAMLAAIAEAGPGGADAVLVKLAKPGQEMRVDLPTIGPRTVERAAAGGLAGIAVEAGAALVLERAETVRQADAAGLFVAGLATDELESARPAPASADTPLAQLGRRSPRPADRRDIAIGRRLLQVLAAHHAGLAAVVAGEHVLAVDAAAPVTTVLARLGRGSHWGLRVFRRRIGVLVIDGAAPGTETPTAIVAAAAAAGLAGIAAEAAARTAWAMPETIARADAAGLFLLAAGSASRP